MTREQYEALWDAIATANVQTDDQALDIAKQHLGAFNRDAVVAYRDALDFEFSLNDAALCITGVTYERLEQMASEGFLPVKLDPMLPGAALLRAVLGGSGYGSAIEPVVTQVECVAGWLLG